MRETREGTPELYEACGFEIVRAANLLYKIQVGRQYERAATPEEVILWKQLVEAHQKLAWFERMESFRRELDLVRARELASKISLIHRRD